MAKSMDHVERSLKFLAHMPRVSMANIRDFYGAKKKKKRRGRGDKTAGKGHKGQGQHQGTMKPYLGFEGGQSPFYRNAPKHHMLAPGHVKKLQFATLNLNRIQYFIDCGRIDPSKPITFNILKNSNLITGNSRDGVRLKGEGHTWFQGKIDIEVTRASQDAIAAIERNGGRVKCVWHDPVTLQHKMSATPSKNFRHVPPVAKRPNERLLLYYANPYNRGYLANPEEIEKSRLDNVALGPVVDQLKGLTVSDVSEEPVDASEEVSGLADEVD